MSGPDPDPGRVTPSPADDESTAGIVENSEGTTVKQGETPAEQGVSPEPGLVVEPEGHAADPGEPAACGTGAEPAEDGKTEHIESEVIEPSEPSGGETDALRAELEERTADLRRVTAEYANYRKRVDRDRALAADQAIGTVLSALLPVLDDLDRARDHGDLTGPFGSVAEQLTAALGKFGLTSFGTKGDPFDPTRHEAVAHLTSAEVTEPSCFDVLRRGYMLGDRLLRAAMVAVADPE